MDNKKTEKKTRPLSEAEQARKDRFEKRKAELEAEGYTLEPMTFNVWVVQIMSIVVMLPLVVPMVVWYMSVNQQIEISFSFMEIFLFCFGTFALVVLHELIHGATWALFTKDGFKAISFGVIWHMLTPYCTCNEEMGRWKYILGAVMPTILVGILPCAIAVAIGSPVLLFVGIIMIIGGGGDMMMTWKLLRYQEKGTECRYLDHPYDIGMIAIYRRTASASVSEPVAPAGVADDS